MAQRQIFIRRTKPKETRIQNGIIWDRNLGNMARFTLIAMLSLPDTWDYSVRGMATMLNLSKDTMSKYMKELEQAGYLMRRQAHGENGKFSSADYVLTDTPWEFGVEGGAAPCPENPDAAGTEPCPENSDAAGAEPCPNFPAPKKPAPKNSPQKKRTKEQKRTEEYTPCSPPAGDGSATIGAQGSLDRSEGKSPGPAQRDRVLPEAEGKRPGSAPNRSVTKPQQPRREKSMPSHDPEAFETFWAAYPRKDDRKAAIRMWDRLRPDRELCRTMYAALKRHRRSRQWAEEDGRYIPLFSTWLNGRKWENQGVDRSLLAPSGGVVVDLEAPS